jgi:hypothetical protein
MFLKVIETNTDSEIVHSAVSGIRYTLAYSIIDENGIMTENPSVKTGKGASP